MNKKKKETNYEEERHRKLNNTGYDILKTIKIKEESKEQEYDDDTTEVLEELNTQEKTIVNLIQNIQQGSKKEFEPSTSQESNDNTRDLFQELMGDNENTIVMSPIDEEELNNNNIKDTLLNMTRELEAIKEPSNDLTQDLIVEKEKLKKKYLGEEKDNEDESVEEETNKIDEAPKISNVDKSFYTNSISFNKTDFEGFEDLEKSERKSGILAKIGIFIIIIILGVTIFLILNSIFEWNII